MKKNGIGLLAGLLCVLLLTGMLSACSGGKEVTTETTTTAMPTVTTRALIAADIGSLITTQEVSDIMGTEMQDGTVSAQGSTLTFIGKESTAVLSIDMDQKPYDTFDYMLQGYSDLVYAPNLAQEAWWSQTYNQLLTYGKGYMLLTEITLPESDNEQRQLAARRVTAWMVERLPDNG